LINTALKRAFERARPLHDLEATTFAGYSFPSGHSSGALVAYGMLAYVLMRTLPRGWHLPAAMLCAAAAFSVGASRIFLQAHFATDVAAGFASGSAWLAICILSVEWAHRERRAA
jgi:undecaprenyl-diphosphatase